MEIIQHFTTLLLTEEEQEYINEYREVFSDGEIAPRDQHYLDKLRKINGISEDRANELESIAQE